MSCTSAHAVVQKPVNCERSANVEYHKFFLSSSSMFFFFSLGLSRLVSEKVSDLLDRYLNYCVSVALCLS